MNISDETNVVNNCRDTELCIKCKGTVDVVSENRREKGMHGKGKEEKKGKGITPPPIYRPISS